MRNVRKGSSMDCLFGAGAKFCTCCRWLPKRYVIVTLCCLGMVSISAMRVNLSVTILTLLDEAPENKVSTIQAIISLPNVHWTPKMIGYLRSMFAIGYLVMQIPGGYLAMRLSPQKLFGGCVSVAALLNLLFPTCMQNNNYYITCALRLIQGMSEGLLYPSSFVIIWRWSLHDERSGLGALILSGVYLGALVGYPLSGYLTDIYGWSYAYYVHGVIAFCWIILWILFSHDDPDTHPTITEAERTLLRANMTNKSGNNIQVPWKEILTSRHVYALFMCNFAFYLLYTNGPGYVFIFGYSILTTTKLASLPPLVLTLSALSSGFLADVLMRDPMLQPTQVRKMFTCIGFGVEALCFIFLSFIDIAPVAILFLTLGVGFSGFTVPGWQINPMDLAPHYASILIGVSNCFGTIAGIVSPIAIGYATTKQTIQSWQLTFGCFGATVGIASLVYGLFGSAERQPWAQVENQVIELADRSCDEDGDDVQKSYGTCSRCDDQ